MKKRLLIIFIIVFSLMISACGKDDGKLYGFSLLDVTYSESLGGDIYSFYHEKSGANLVYIQNDDPELAFSINYHVPMVDETDTNHVFEHAIISGSKKYPSSNIFFDMINRSYNTYINASTDLMLSSFPVSSMSEEQLIKLADVYLSCMVDPDIIRNENIFKREAVRYQLYDKDEEIELLGSVYAEDAAGETEVFWSHMNNVLDSLYPGEYASNCLGRTNYEYSRLTYENVVATYERCYHFDNSVMVLYGDLDYKKFLEFLDKEYLSKEKKFGTNLDMYMDKISSSGFRDVVYDSPAYIGDDVSEKSSISYLVDLSDLDWDTILKLSFLSEVELSPYSVYRQNLLNRGIYYQATSEVNIYSAKPYIEFTLNNADASCKDEFYNSVLDTINTLSTEGENPELIRKMLKEAELKRLLKRNENNVGANLGDSFAVWWVHTGEVNIFKAYERNLKEFEDNPDKIIKEIATAIANPTNSAMATTTPKPGLSEQLALERDNYLKQMKDKMTDEELTKFIEASYAFDEWNHTFRANDDFMIDIKDLPEVELDVEMVEMSNDSLKIVYAPVELEKVGEYRLFLDTSAIDNEDILYLKLLTEACGYFDTEDYTAEEIDMFYDLYLNECRNTFQYINDAQGNKYPTLAIIWDCLTEDFEKSLDMLINIYAKTDYSDADTFIYFLEMSKEYFNLSKTNPNDICYEYATSGTRYQKETSPYNVSIMENYYQFLNDLLKELKNDPEYIYQINDKLHEIVEKIFVKGKVVFLFTASDEVFDTVVASVSEEVEKWDTQTVEQSMFRLPIIKKNTAIIMDSGTTEGMLIGEGSEYMKGRYAPYIKLLSDQYINQKIRIENGAYSASAEVLYQADPSLYMWSSADLNNDKTIDVFHGSVDFLNNTEVDEEELEGYILSAYSELTNPDGLLYHNILWMTRSISGMDPVKRIEFINDIKNATVKDKEAATNEIGYMIENSVSCFAGNERILRKAGDKYDTIISYRQ